MEEVYSTPGAEGPPESPKSIGCEHYKRKSKFVTPCCDKIYVCRFCHDENEDHILNRKEITNLICSICNTKQKVQNNCENCGILFGKYACLKCNLFDDENKKQFHCDGCGICRIGGSNNFFHCLKCNMCLPTPLQESHKCVENVSRNNCPICLEDIHTSRIPCHIPPCGHLLHRPCLERLLEYRIFACPTCQTSLMNMKEVWKSLDLDIANTPMPVEYRNYYVEILCKDCHKECLVKFHVIGLKCLHCGSYNTCRNRGPVFVTSFAWTILRYVARFCQFFVNLTRNIYSYIPFLFFFVDAEGEELGRDEVENQNPIEEQLQNAD